MTDYVIVGAGSAGCVLAEALSAKHRVVLFEAGGDDRALEVAIPAAYPKLFQTGRDWGFHSAPEPGANDRALYLPRGRMIGGSSSMNAGLYIRGRPSDYDGWEEGGATGWSWDSVLPLFKQMENNSRGADELHGGSGPVHVSDLRSPNPVSRRWVEAAVAAGIPPNHDFNGSKQEGVGFFQVNQRRGRRWSASDAFLRPAAQRPTLAVVSEATVTRIVIEQGRAVGVEYESGGRLSVIRAEAEVIVSAGAYGSPHLLQVSGIGDPAALMAAGIAPLIESPQLGENLADHPVIGLIYDCLLSGTLDDADNLFELARWVLLRNGRLTSPIAEAGAFVRSSPDLGEPDLQFHFGPANFEGHGMESYPGNAFSFGPVLVSPRSRGWVRARTPHITDPPEIRSNCLTDDRDLEALIRGVELAREIVAQRPLDDYRGRELHPGRAVVNRSDIAEFIRERVELLYHPAGTCRMGSDPSAVVDPELRVTGLTGLRVADASIMPTVVSGNTNAPTMMIGARAAQLILGG